MADKLMRWECPSPCACMCIDRLADEIDRLRAVLRDVERVAGPSSGYTDAQDVLTVIQRMIQQALTGRAGDPT